MGWWCDTGLFVCLFVFGVFYFFFPASCFISKIRNWTYIRDCSFFACGALLPSIHPPFCFVLCGEDFKRRRKDSGLPALLGQKVGQGF